MAALPDINTNEAAMTIAAEGAYMSRELSDIDHSLISIFDVLTDIVKVNERTAKAIEGVLRIESERRQDENISEGLDLERERESTKVVESDFGKKIDKFADRLTMDNSTFGAALATAAGAAMLFSDQVRDAWKEASKFLNQFGLEVGETATILAGTRAGLKTATPAAPKPVTPPVVAPKASPLQGKTFKPAGSLVTGSPSAANQMYFNSTKGQGANSLTTGKISEASKKFFESAKPAVQATAKAASNVTGNIANKVVSGIGRVATPVAIATSAFDVGQIMQSDLPENEKKVEYSKVGGRLAGAWMGGKAGATAGAVGGPWGMLGGAIAGSIAGMFAGEEISEFLARLGFDAPMSTEDRLKTIPSGGDEFDGIDDAVPSSGFLTERDVKFGRRAKEVQAAEQLRKIKSIEPSISGNNLEVTVKVEQASREKVDPARVTPIIRHGDTINKTIIQGGSGNNNTGKSVPSATKLNPSPGSAGQTELMDWVNGP